MMIKIESEDHSYNAIDTFELWKEVDEFINDYRINQVDFGNSINIHNFRLKHFTRMIKPWQDLTSDQKDKVRRIKNLMENPILLAKLKKGRMSFKASGLDKNVMSTNEISQKVLNELKKTRITPHIFVKKVLGLIGQNSINNYLINPKPWNKFHESTERNFLKMFIWLNNPNRFDIFAIKSDHDSTADQSKTDLMAQYNIKQPKIIIKKMDLASIINLSRPTSLPKQNENSTQSDENDFSKVIQELKTRCDNLEDQLKQIKEEKNENQEIQDLNNRLKVQEDELLNLKRLNHQHIQQPVSADSDELNDPNEKNQFLVLKIQNLENENQNLKVIIDQILFQQRQLQQSHYLLQQQFHNLQARIPFQIPTAIPLATAVPLNDTNVSN